MVASWPYLSLKGRLTYAAIDNVERQGPREPWADHMYGSTIRTEPASQTGFTYAFIGTNRCFIYPHSGHRDLRHRRRRCNAVVRPKTAIATRGRALSPGRREFGSRTLQNTYFNFRMEGRNRRVLIAGRNYLSHNLVRMPSFHRVLVIAGGGAKGAYAFGCLKAFRERGETFDGVAGASAGALNALIWSTGCFEKGESLWKSMSFETVYPFRMFDPARYPPVLTKGLSAAYVLGRLTWSAITGIDTPLRRLWIALFSLAAATAITISLTLVFHIHLRYVPLLFLGVAAAQFLLLITGRRMDRLFVFSRLAVILSLPALSFLTRHISLGLALLLIASLTILLVHFLHRVFGYDIAVLSQSGLAKSLNEILAEPLNIPTVVALSREAKINDPDDPRYYFDQAPPGPGSTAFPDTKRVWVSEYFYLNDLERDGILRACLASAALPFGIVQPVIINGKIYVDGGLTDNVPVFPFLDDPKVVEVYIIALQPVVDWKRFAHKIGFDQQSWSQKDRVARVAKYPIQHQVLGLGTWGRNRPPKIIPFRTLGYLPRPILFQPKRPLGTFLSGTLNFDGTYAECLIKQGYEDTIRALERNRESPST